LIFAKKLVSDVNKMMSHNVYAVGDLICRHWRAAGMSQARLGKAFGKTAGAVGQWETPKLEKRNRPTLENLYQVAGALNLTMADFFTGPDSGP
jgi:transcriptional regulator with XRE-family HTH domain